MTLPTAGHDDPRLPTDDDIAAATADAAGPVPDEPDLDVDRAGAAEAERVAPRPDF